MSEQDTPGPEPSPGQIQVTPRVGADDWPDLAGAEVGIVERLGVRYPDDGARVLVVTRLPGGRAVVGESSPSIFIPSVRYLRGRAASPAAEAAVTETVVELLGLATATPRLLARLGEQLAEAHAADAIDLPALRSLVDEVLAANPPAGEQ